jgi:hypothetical protein
MGTMGYSAYKGRWGEIVAGMMGGILGYQAGSLIIGRSAAAPPAQGIGDGDPEGPLDGAIGPLVSTVTDDGGVVIGGGSDWAVVRLGYTAYFAGHSDGEKVWMEGVPRGPDFLASRLHGMKGMSGVKSLVLLSCSSGSKAFSQGLANAMGMPVMAPIDWVHASSIYGGYPRVLIGSSGIHYPIQTYAWNIAFPTSWGPLDIMRYHQVHPSSTALPR